MMKGLNNHSEVVDAFRIHQVSQNELYLLLPTA